MPTITRNTAPYNDRRYGKPYIARINFDADPNGAASWGTWIGSAGQEGLLTIDAEVGDIVMTGQKDYRGWGSRPNYHAVLPDGSLSKDMTKLQAYKHAKTKVQAVPVG